MSSKQHQPFIRMTKLGILFEPQMKWLMLSLTISGVDVPNWK